MLLAFLSILCVPFSDINGTQNQKIAVYVIAVVFWTSVILEQVFLKICGTERDRQKNKCASTDISEGVKGIRMFLRNREAEVAAGAFLLSAVIMMIMMILRVQSVWAVILDVGILFLSLNSYCMASGRNYRYMKEYRGGKEK